MRRLYYRNKFQIPVNFLLYFYKNEKTSFKFHYY